MELKNILLEQKPIDYGIDRNIWTGKIISKKMLAQLQPHLSCLNIQDKIVVEFIYTPPYSPDFNLAEYIIHFLRLQLLHHLPSGINIQQLSSILPASNTRTDSKHYSTYLHSSSVISQIRSQVVCDHTVKGFCLS